MKSRIDKLKYRFEISNKSKFYYKNDDYHRDKDLPAVIWSTGSKLWYKKGLEHRDNGNPSSIFSNGKKEWWENGILLKRDYEI